MVSFEKSPGGVPIVERIAANDIEEQTQLVRDIEHLIANEQIEPGTIVILLNSAKEASSLASMKAIAGFPLESTYSRYDSTAKRIFNSTIVIFKGLEADVVFVLLGDGTKEAEISNAL